MTDNNINRQLVDKLLCDNVKALTPYQSARRLFSSNNQADWLNANESPYTNSYQLDDAQLNRYPDCQPTSLLEAYANYADVTAEQVLVSRGADEGIELLIRAFCQPGKDKILICPPTYGMYQISANTFNVAVEQAPLTQEFALDLPAILAFKEQVKLVFICSPNNPTGTLAEKQKLLQLLEAYANSALVVVDEAYIEFAWSQNWSQELAQYPNLVILRTLSKAFALAGIRCGFTLANPLVIQALLKVIAPYPIPEPVAQIATQALSQKGLALCKQQVGQLQAQQHTLLRELNGVPQLQVIGGQQANFILIRCQQKQALMAFLCQQGILVRDQSKQMYLQDCLRLSIGDRQQNQKLASAIKHFYQQQEKK